MTDAELARALERGELPNEGFHHADHLRVALVYLHGVGAIAPGLEKALTGKQEGDQVKVKLTPAEGFGERSEQAVRNLPLRKLPEKNPRPGMRIRLQTDRGPATGTVLAVKGDYATVDLNHPFAGMTLQFEVTIVSVREATAEELEHGHVHAPGAHQH